MIDYFFHTKNRSTGVQNRQAGRIIFAILFLFFSLDTLAQNDLPNPPSHFQTVPAGSFVVPMDTIYQSIVPAGQAPFNLKAYGLVNKFLQNGIPVKWAILSSKHRDDIDFTANAARYAPSFVAASNINFRGGPFIVPDTILPCGLSTRQIISSFGNNVAVYQLTNNTTVDVRYTLVHRPKIAVFNNGGNQLIHTKILDAAGIPNYDVMDAVNIGNLVHCYTFVSEPHADTNEISIPVVNAVKSFVANGGNFLAQCHAVNSYENKAFFHTTSGISIVNSVISHLYPNADLAFSQMHGPLQQNEGGSIHNWTLKAGSSWLPSAYKSVSHTGPDTVVAMGAHVIAPGAIGGNVFYLGGHDYSKGGKINTVADLSILARVNGLRLYLNGVFVPSRNSNGAWANAGPGSTIGCSQSVTLGCNLTGPPGSTFLWTPSTGLSCTTCPNPVAQPTSTTLYTVQVTNGCIATDTVRIVVVTPVAQFVNDTVCAGNSTTFASQSAGSIFWSWNFGDPSSGSANVSTLQNPAHLFTSAGSFTVRLIAGINPSCADTIIKTVVVNPLPVVTVNPVTICAGKTATLKATGAISYLWSNGSVSDSIIVSPVSSTLYTVRGTNARGCSDVVNSLVTVIPFLVPVTSNTNVSCFGGSDGTAAVVVGGGKPGYSYSWNSVPVQTNAQATGLRTGTYTVVIIDAGGCTITASATITEPPLLTATLAPTNVKCNNGSDGTIEAIVAGGTTNYNYSWNTNPIQRNVMATGLTKGTYTLVVTDAKGCTVTANATLTEPPGMILTTGTTNVKCYGGNDGAANVTVTGNTPPYTYSWNTTPVRTSAQLTGIQKGTYTVTVTDSIGCPANATVVITEPPAMVVDLGPDQKLCPESDIPAIFNAGPGYKFLWHPTGDTSQQIAVRVPGTYSVTVTNQIGCSTRVSANLREVCPPRLFISNSFTPNGDSINDHYNVYGAHFNNFHMFIFNRWGEIIFESKDRNIVWDGVYRKEPMPIGVYPWIITYTGDSEEYYGPFRLEGSVTVVR
jgi:gliding motility-associated-like protein